jgi:YihY family inner membrane protein
MHPGEVVRRLDALQRRHQPTSFGFAVVKKYGDDRGGALAALLTYYGFLAVFPLLLILTTVVGYLLASSPALSERLLSSAAVDFPIIGQQLTSSIHSLRGSGVALVVGLIGLVWGSLAVTNVAQHAMAEVWNVPDVERPGFVTRLRQGLLLIGVLGGGLVATTALTTLVTIAGPSPVSRIGGMLFAVAIDVALFVAGFRVATPKAVPTRELVPGAVVAGVAWSLLQLGGGLLVGHQLRHASEVYGYFASVLGLLWWIYLGAQVTVFAAEVNVVRAKHLWPRSLVQPPMTAADVRVLGDIARQAVRRPEEHVVVSFDAPVEVVVDLTAVEEGAVEPI